jgi:hypothetical protein
VLSVSWIQLRKADVLRGSPSATPLQVVAQLVDGFWHWIEGPHGRWFDKLLGAVHALIALFIFLVNAAVLKVVQGRTAKDAKGFLDYKLDAENAMRTLPSMLDKLTKIMNQVSPAMSKHTGSTYTS